jgi:hypothetical protein
MFEHGSYTIEVRQRILVARILDAWNLKTAIHFCNEMEKLAVTMSGEPWAILSDLTQWQLSTPEVGAEIARQAVKLDSLGSISSITAYVISTAFRSPVTTSPRPARTRSASWHLPSATV